MKKLNILLALVVVMSLMLAACQPPAAPAAPAEPAAPAAPAAAC